MSTAQKDPIQFTPTEDRHDQAREQQMIFPRLLDADLKIVAAREIRPEGMEARLHLTLYDIIEIVRKVGPRVRPA